ncbi:MAG TPA: flagellar assembly protein FliW [Candidatus Ozemobacteraceae bacterium]
MKITTTRFGEIDIVPEEIVVFSEGLLGFDEVHRFIILNPQDGSPFRWLQCVDDGDLAFVIIEPLSFMFAYDLEIADADAAFLGLEKAEDAVLYAIVTIPENPSDMTANLQGPLVINAKSRKGRQVISTNTQHSVKARILDEMKRRAEEIRKVTESLESSGKKEGEG